MTRFLLASLLAATLWPASADPGGSLEGLLAGAYQLAASQDVPGAVGRYRQAARLAHGQKALWQEVEALTRLLHLQPDNSAWAVELRRCLETNFPLYLSDQTRLVCPLPLTDVTLTFRDPRVVSGFQGRRYGLYIRPERLPMELINDQGTRADPRQIGRFDRVLGGYVFEDTKRLYDSIDGAWKQCFRVFYPSPARAANGRDYTALAEQVATTLLKFYWIAWEYLGRTPQFVPTSGTAAGRPIEVWLCEGGEGAGEQWQHHLYLYQIGTPRKGLEWLRELAHEYGHHVLPPFGREWTGAEHETWLNGELGERLFLPWLAANLPPDPDDQTPWEREAWSEDLFTAYHRTATRPLVAQFLEQGPESPLATDPTDAGATYALGLALSIPARHGPALLRETLDRFHQPHAKILPRDVNDLRQAYERALKDRAEAGYTISPAGFTPATSRFREPPATTDSALLLSPGEVAAYWFYLPTGHWHLTLTADGPEAFQIEAVFDGSVAVPLRFSGSSQATTAPLRGDGRWHSLRLAPMVTDEAVNLQGIRVWRSGEV